METEKRKTRFLGLVLLVLLMLSGFSLNLPVAHAASYPVSEDFESWNDNTWNTYGALTVPSSAAAYAGSYGLRINSTATYTAVFYEDPLLAGGVDSFSVVIYFRVVAMGRASYAGMGIFSCLTTGSVANWGIDVDVYANQSLWFEGWSASGSGGAVLEIERNTWYKLIYAAECGDSADIVVTAQNLGTLSTTTLWSTTEDNNDYGKPAGFYFGKTDAVSGLTSLDIHFDNVMVGVMPSVSADLEPDDTGPDWVFTEWRYYTFTVEIPSELYSGSLDYVYIGFTEVLLSNGTFGFAAWSNSSGWDSAVNLPYATRDLEPIRTKSGSWETDENGTTITFPLWFTKSCLDIWLEEDAVDVLVWYNDTTGSSSGWEIIEADYFRIYTDGGFSRVSSGWGDSGALPGGRDFSLFAYNDSYVFKDLYWRDLQHIKLVPEIQFRAGYQYFQLNYGIDYILKDGSYQAGLNLQFEPDAVSYTGVFASNVWINYTVSWYDNNTWVKSEDLYSFYHGEVYTAGDYGRVKFFIDFWFDSGNASSLVAGRINAYEFPMQDASATWLRWLSSTWGVMDDVTKQSECIVPIHSSSETVINSENIEFVRIWSSLAVPGAAYDQYVAVLGFDTFDTTLSPEPTLKGIFTPPWDETKMPVVGNTGLLGAIWSMFAGIGKWLSDNIIFGGLSLWPTFVAFLDTIASWLGIPNGFSNLIAWLGTGWAWLVSSFTYALTIIYDIFLMLAAVMGSLIWMLGQSIVSFASVIGMIAGFLAGTFGGAGDLWTQLGLSTWITVAIIFYPLYLIILWDQKGMDAVISQLSMIWGIMSWLAHFFISIIQTIITVISGVVESIPVVE